MLKNITEILVEQRLDQLWEKKDCCKCERCREDVLAYALSRLPAQYVSTRSGELYAKTKVFSQQYGVEILSELVRAIEIVAEQPRHE